MAFITFEMNTLKTHLEEKIFARQFDALGLQLNIVPANDGGKGLEIQWKDKPVPEELQKQFLRAANDYCVSKYGKSFEPEFHFSMRQVSQEPSVNVQR